MSNEDVEPLLVVLDVDNTLCNDCSELDRLLIKESDD